MGHSGKKGKKGTVVCVKLVRADRKNPPCVIAGGFFFLLVRILQAQNHFFSPLMPFLAALLNCGFFREQTLNETRKFQYDTNIKNLTL